MWAKHNIRVNGILSLKKVIVLNSYCSADDELQIQLRKSIDGVKYYCTGNLTWR